MMERLKSMILLPPILCFVFIVLGIIFEQASSSVYPIFYLLAILFGGYAQTKEGLIELFTHRTFNVDLLMALAAIGACLIGDYREGAILTFIFCLSGALETYTMNKSRKELTSLMKLQPKTAQRYLPNGEKETIPVEDLAIGDRIFVAKGQSLPIDGFLQNARAAIDESAISGESIPVEKIFGEEVFGGTLNVGDPFDLEVSKTNDETIFSKIIQLIKEAQNIPTKTASFIERIENTYVKCVLVAVPLMMLVCYFIFSWSLQESFYRGMVLLVVASPCALVASATPATLAALSNAAKNGILIKGGIHLEQLAELKAVAFDKTGTLTKGKPIVTDTMFLQDEELARLMLVAMESKTTHPLAQAIVQAFDLSLPAPLHDLDIQEVTGSGLLTTYQQSTWKVGKHAYDPETMDVAPEVKEKIALLEEQGKTVIYLSRDDQLTAILGLLDVPKENAQEVIAYFEEHGVQTSMITGDHPGTAKAIAQQIGITNYHAGCTPEEKTELIKAKRAEVSVNAMVGDGVNDAPALAAASIGIAMGKGTDIAMDVADLVLVKNDLSKLVYSHKLSLKLRKIIKQNIIFSVSVICLLVLSNFIQILNLPIGVVGHEGSTILVILNGLRLLRGIDAVPNPRTAKKTKQTIDIDA